MMQNDFPRWQAFLERMKEVSEQLVNKSDKVAVCGAQSVREGDEEGGQGDLANGWGRT